MFREFVVLCRQLDLFGRELLAVDGTRNKAVNTENRNFTRSSLAIFIQEADAKLSAYMARLDESYAGDERAVRTLQGGAAVILDIARHDPKSALFGERIERRPGSGSVLLVGRGSEIGADEH